MDSLSLIIYHIESNLNVTLSDVSVLNICWALDFLEDFSSFSISNFIGAFIHVPDFIPITIDDIEEEDIVCVFANFYSLSFYESLLFFLICLIGVLVLRIVYPLFFSL